MRKVVIYRRAVLNLRKTTADDEQRKSSFVEIEQTRKRDSFYLFTPLLSRCRIRRYHASSFSTISVQCRTRKNVIKMCLFSFYTINPLAASSEQILYISHSFSLQLRFFILTDNTPRCHRIQYRARMKLL